MVDDDIAPDDLTLLELLAGQMKAATDPRRCPKHLAESLEAYAEKGTPVGDFLQAVLANDLFDAVGRADHINIRLIPNIVSFVYRHLPRACHGSREQYTRWINAHLERIRAERKAGEP